MIAADTSSWIAYLQDAAGADVASLRRGLAARAQAMVPAVISELLSFPALPNEHRGALLHLPRLPLAEGFWERAGDLRRVVLSRGRKARLGDTLIAQTCLDHAVSLITSDPDFAAFAAAAGLEALLHSTRVE